MKDDDPVQLRMDDIYDHSFVSIILTDTAASDEPICLCHVKQSLLEEWLNYPEECPRLISQEWLLVFL
jgi:hypothetical protein